MKHLDRQRLWLPATLLILAAAPAATAQTYTVVDLGHVSNAPEDSYKAVDVNLARQAVGQVDTFPPVPLLFADGTATPLPLPTGFLRGEAFAINASGQIVGYMRSGGFFGTQRPAFWAQGAAAPPIDLGGGRVARDLNDAGVIAGEAVLSGFTRAVIWNSVPGPIDLGTLGGTTATAYGINAHNDVVGSSALPGFGTVAAVWPAAGAPVSLGALAGGNFSVAYAVNDAGLAVGHSDDGTPPYEPGAPAPARAVYWDAARSIHQIDAPGPDMQSFAFDVNNRGEIVGTITAYPHGDETAFLFSDQCGLVDLNTFLDPEAPFHALHQAFGINDRGDIVGVGIHAACCSLPHAFLMLRNDDAVGAVENPCGGVFTTDLIAGQNQLAGSVCVANDGVNLCVEYKANPGWSICETHMDIELEYTDFPLSRNGNPKIGQFSYQGEHPGGVSSVTYCIPLAEFGYEPGDLLLIAAHAAMCNGETAWGAGIDFTGNNWATYFTYEMQSCCE